MIPSHLSEEPGNAFQHTLSPEMLRDYFAAKAMAAMLAAPQGKFTHEHFDQVAADAYLMADTMIKERAK